jgi:hypothetical protein
MPERPVGRSWDRENDWKLRLDGTMVGDWRPLDAIFNEKLEN